MAELLGMDKKGEQRKTKHKRFYEIYDEVGPDAWSTYTVASTVRHPYDCMTSDYHFNQKLYARGRRDALRTFCMENDLDAFVKLRHNKAFMALRDETGALNLNEDKHLVCSTRGVVKVDVWLRQEHLAEDLDLLAEAAGLSLAKELPKVNPSKNPGASALSDSSKALIRTSSAAIFDAFYPDTRP